MIVSKSLLRSDKSSIFNDTNPDCRHITETEKMAIQEFPTTLLEKINRMLHLQQAECPYVNLGYYLTFLGKKYSLFTASEQEF